MPIRAFLRRHWPAITITVTAAAIGCAAFVMLGNMPPHRIVMATGPEGSAYEEDGRRYQAALAKADVEAFFTAAPRPRTPSELLYSDRRLRSKSSPAATILIRKQDEVAQARTTATAGGFHVLIAPVRRSGVMLGTSALSPAKGKG